jgi:hypothetical protein
MRAPDARLALARLPLHRLACGLDHDPPQDKRRALPSALRLCDGR